MRIPKHGSGDRLAARVTEIDIDTVTERVTSEQSAARPAPFGNKAAGVGKPKRFRPRGSWLRRPGVRW